MVKPVVALLSLSLALVSPPASAGAPARADIAPATVRADLFPEAATRYPGGIVARGGVEFANITGYRPLLLDLYTHKDVLKAPARTLVIYVHGGGWNRGDSRGSGTFADFPAVLAELAARGYVVASVNYRMSGEARFPAPVQDIKAAIRFLRVNAVTYGIDPDRVIIWGGSAGAHLAAMTATTCGDPAFEPMVSTGRMSGSEAKKATTASDVSDCVQGAVFWYGLFDLRSPIAPLTGSLTQMLGCAPDACPEIAANASPVTHVSAKTPPILLIHGTADTTAPTGQSRAMETQLRAAGVPVESLYIPEVDHGFLGQTPEATRDASLTALQRTFDFIDTFAVKPEK